MSMLHNKFTGSKIIELGGQQGRTVTVTPGPGATLVEFQLNSLPTQKDSKFWYYAEDIWIKMRCTITLATDTLFGGFFPHQLWQLMQSSQLQTPLLGTMFQHSNTRGTVLGNCIMPVSWNYNRLPRPALLGANGNTSVVYNMMYRLPFAQSFLANPMETAPWTGFLEGGKLQINVAPSNVLAGLTSGATFSSCTVEATAYAQPEPEARIHTPVVWREHESAASTKHVIADMGSPDGLQGINQAKGCGLAFFGQLMNIANTGLNGSTTALNVLQVDMAFRDQPRIENTEELFINQLKSMGQMPVGGALAAPTEVTWPYIDGIVGSGFVYNNATALVQPLVPTGTNVNTSKLQTVAGAKEINMSYTQNPTVNSRFVGCYLPVFDDQYAESLVSRIAPASSGKLSPKTLNKQQGGEHGYGKLAYTAQKVA